MTSCSAAYFKTIHTAIATTALLAFSSLGVRNGVSHEDENDEVEIRGVLCHRRFTYRDYLTPCSALSEILSHCSIKRKHVERPDKVLHLPMEFDFSVHPYGLGVTTERLSRGDKAMEQHPEDFRDRLLAMDKSQVQTAKDLLQTSTKNQSSCSSSSFSQIDVYLKQKVALINRLPFEVVRLIAKRFERSR
ncbi:hypothetical protein BGZ59_007832 [Podila verticillata]|nr:hypothetical protein BGZ59_007832 [Podila verticillata]